MANVEVVTRGPKGLTAAEQAYLAGKIAEPTEGALDAYLRAPALNAAAFADQATAGATAASASADTAAANANAKAAAAQAVVDASGEILAARDETLVAAESVIGISDQVKSSGSPAFRVRDLLGRVMLTVGQDAVARAVGFVGRSLQVGQASVTSLVAQAGTVGGATLATGGSYMEALKDAAGRVVRVVDLDGTHRMVAVTAKRVTATVLNAGSAAFSSLTAGGATLGTAAAFEVLRDAAGRTIRRVDADGTHNVTAVTAKRLTAGKAFLLGQFRATGDKRAGTFRAEINHVLWYGQSWAGGFDSAPPLSLVQNADTLSFNVNAQGETIRQQYSVAQDATALQSFVPAVEVQHTGSPEFGNTLGETGAVSACDTIKRLVLAEQNIAFTEQAWQLLVSYPGEGSKQIETLADNAQPYMQRLKEQIARGFAIAQAQGKTYNVAAVTWIQGSTSIATPYADQLEAMRADISAYAKSITGQENEVYLVTWQQYPNTNTDAATNGSARGVYIRFVVAADTYPYVVCTGPSYQYEQLSASNIHFRNVGMRELGADLGLAVKRAVVDGVKFQPLRPIGLRRQGRIALLKLNVAGGALVVDTTQVVTAANLGFNLYDSAGNLLPLASVTLAGHDTVKLTAVDPIPAGATLRYADTGTDATNANKWRGNIRDNLASVGQRNRWLVAFSYAFSN